MRQHHQLCSGQHFSPRLPQGCQYATLVSRNSYCHLQDNITIAFLTARFWGQAACIKGRPPNWKARCLTRRPSKPTLDTASLGESQKRIKWGPGGLLETNNGALPGGMGLLGDMSGLQFSEFHLRVI
eukprot:1160094-Pelagomonas_calceolata.AAC.6